MIGKLNEDSFTVKCMEAAGTGDFGEFRWPHKDDIIQISAETIIDLLPDPIPLSQRHIGWNKSVIEHVDREFLMR